eukprot:Nk52_evm21s252 gene=Nk52_evmTU21s252
MSKRQNRKVGPYELTHGKPYEREKTPDNKSTDGVSENEQQKRKLAETRNSLLPPIAGATPAVRPEEKISSEGGEVDNTDKNEHLEEAKEREGAKFEDDQGQKSQHLSANNSQCTLNKSQLLSEEEKEDLPDVQIEPCDDSDDDINEDYETDEDNDDDNDNEYYLGSGSLDDDIPIGSTYGQFRQSYFETHQKSKRRLIWAYMIKNIDMFKVIGFCLLLLSLGLFLFYLILQTSEYVKADTTTTVTFVSSTTKNIPGFVICKTLESFHFKKNIAYLTGASLLASINRTLSCTLNSQSISCGKVVNFYHPYPVTNVNYCVMINSASVNPDLLQFGSPGDSILINFALNSTYLDDGLGVIMGAVPNEETFIQPQGYVRIDGGSYTQYRLRKSEFKRIKDCEEGKYSKQECIFSEQKKCIVESCNCTYINDLFRTQEIDLIEKNNGANAFPFPMGDFGTTDFIDQAILSRSWEINSFRANITVDDIRNTESTAKAELILEGIVPSTAPTLNDTTLQAFVYLVNQATVICDNLVMRLESTCFHQCNKPPVSCDRDNCNLASYPYATNSIPISQKLQDNGMVAPELIVPQLVSVTVVQSDSNIEVSEEDIKYPFLSYAGEVSGMFGFLLGASLMNLIYLVANFPQILKRAKEFDAAEAFKARQSITRLKESAPPIVIEGSDDGSGQGEEENTPNGDDSLNASDSSLRKRSEVSTATLPKQNPNFLKVQVDDSSESE